MRYSLINPAWDFTHSIYFGCREPHLPLEFGYAKALLEEAGHDVQLLDAQLNDWSIKEVLSRLAQFRPDFTVITTAPSYLFWRCAPPELRIPQQLAAAIRDVCGNLVCVGPHASTTPRTALLKMGAAVAIMGEFEHILPQLAEDWQQRPGICSRTAEGIKVIGGPQAADMSRLPALRWGRDVIERHRHHHHRFDSEPTGPGAEMETSRGCPYHCTFCAKDNFRNSFRRRPTSIVAEELDGLIADGAEYVYFIDEIFLPFPDVIETIAERNISFGIQTRIDLWNLDSIRRLGEAGCVSIEAGVESITEAGREALQKKCKASTEKISDLLIEAKRSVPFVQANLLDSAMDDPREVEAWRGMLKRHGVWSNMPVPLFPYPGSPDYTQRWGRPDDHAWERAHAFYLNQFDEFSDIQEKRPWDLIQLETH